MMTVYRVGPTGATVFNEKGEALARLRPGYTVVPGPLDLAVPRYERAQKRVKGYQDKRITPAEDK